MANVIDLLFRVRWTPRGFNVWRDRNTQLWIMAEGSHAPHIVANAIVEDLVRDKLDKASSHYPGKGLQHGVDWNISLSLLRAWAKSDDYSSQCALETIMCGATWPGQRVAQAYPSGDPQCARCGDPTDDALQSTQRLIPTAVAMHSLYPCLCYEVLGYDLASSHPAPSWRHFPMFPQQYPWTHSEKTESAEFVNWPKYLE